MTSDAPSGKQPQTLKPFTAAKKLGVYLPATPDEFQASPVTREAFAELSTNPPEWLSELRRTGPHPRPVVAQKLGSALFAEARHNSIQVGEAGLFPCAGVYAVVTVAGTIRTGDRVALAAPER